MGYAYLSTIVAYSTTTTEPIGRGGIIRITIKIGEGRETGGSKRAKILCRGLPIGRGDHVHARITHLI